MSDVTAQHSAQKAVLVSGAAVAGLVPTTIEEVFRLAGAVHKAGLAPYGLETPEKLTIAIMTGLEVGLPPMQAVQSIAVINNRPTIWGDGLMAIVRKSPVCLFIREWIEGDGDAMVAKCETHRRGEPGSVERSFSVDDAKKARLWQTKEKVQKRAKGGQGFYEADNDSPWFRFPKRMLQMRARALCLRDVYADLLRGIQVREEVEDYAPREPRDITPAEPAGIARLRAARAAQEPAILPPITEHVEAEIAAMGRETSGGEATVEPATSDQDGMVDWPADDAGVAEEDAASFAPGFVDTLRAYSAALLKGDTTRAIRAHDAAFWQGRGDLDDAELDVVRRIYAQHDSRTTGALDAKHCTAAVEQIIGGIS